MPSVLNVDTVADKAGTGPVALTKQSAAKAYFNVDQTSGAVLDGSFNVSSVTDNSTGDFTITLTNSLNSADDVAVPLGSVSGHLQIHGSYVNTSTVEFLSRDTAPAVSDTQLNTGCIHGALA